MTPIQWLLIGGQQHGKTLWIKYGSRVISGEQIYEGENYLHEGKLYRIGSFMPTMDQRAEIDILIKRERLTPIGERPFLHPVEKFAANRWRNPGD